MKKFIILIFIFTIVVKGKEFKISSWQIPYLNCNVKIDGQLDEECYKKAFKWSNFYQIFPGYNISPFEKTNLFLFVNKKGLVIGIKAIADKIPYSKVKTRRDEFIFGERIDLTFDPEGLGKNFYFIQINATNSIQDGIIDNGEVQKNYDMVFKHATKMRDQFYTIEIFIPFSEIKMPPNEKQKWLFSLQRKINRDVYETDSICKTDRSSNDPKNNMVYLCFKLPEKNQYSVNFLKLIPSFVYSHLKHEEEFFGQSDNFSSDKGDLGLTVEYSPSSNTMLKGTIHPDFSQVEADDAYQRVNNRYPVYLREKRPFFMDGMESFSTPFELLYTRKIVKPEYGIKFSSKFKNRYGLYLISAMEKDVPGERFSLSGDVKHDTYWNVLRTTYNIDNKGSFLGFMAVQRNYGSDFNRVLSADGSIKKGNLTVEFQGVVSTDNFKDKNKTGNASYLDVYYKFNQYISAGFTFEEVSPDFEDDAGFFERVNYKSYNPYFDFNYRPDSDNTFVKKFTISVDATNNYNYSSQLIDQEFAFSTSFSLKHQIVLSLRYYSNSSLYYNRKSFNIHSFTANFIYSEKERFVPHAGVAEGVDVLYGDNPRNVNVIVFWCGVDSNFQMFSMSTNFFIFRYTDRITDETIRKQKALEVVGTYFFNDYMNFKVFFISDLADLRDYDDNEPYHYINLLFTWQKNAFTKLYIGYNNGHSSYRMSDKTLWGFDRDKYFYIKMTYLF